jgi:hypothetical protein
MNLRILGVSNVVLVLVLNCVIILAAKKDENDSKNEILDTKLNQSIFSEGGQNEEEPNKKRIVGRKGVEMDNSTMQFIEQLKASNATHEEIIQNTKNSSSSSKAPEATVTTSTIKSIPAHQLTINSSSTVQNSNFIINKSVESTHNQTNVHTKVDEKVKTSSSVVKNENSLKGENSTTVSIKTTTKKLLTTSTKTTTTTTTTKPRKPSITYSADDNPEIAESEKKINYKVASEKEEISIPKLESDIDRTILEEKKAQRSYMIYFGLVFVLPLSYVLVNVLYRRIKNYLDLRHYQRVNFLVEGMYENYDCN